MKIVHTTILGIFLGTPYAIISMPNLLDIQERRNSNNASREILMNPLVIQEDSSQSNFESFANQLSDLSVSSYFKDLLRLAGGPILIWLAVQRICPSYIEALTPQSGSSILFLGIGVLLASHIGLKSLSDTHPLKIAFVKGMLIIGRLIHPTMTVQEALINFIPPHEPARKEISRFISLLNSEHINALPNPYFLLVLQNNPRAFIAKQEQFIDAICRDDQELAAKRIEYIQGLLEAQSAYKNEPHARAFGDFKNLLMDAVLQELPHKNLIDIAQYRPHLLNRYPKFLKEAANYTIVFNERERKSIIGCFYEALSLAQPHEDHDKAN